VIGGMGTIYGAVIGSVLFLVAQSYLQDLLRLGSEPPPWPWLSALLSPDRWLLWLGLLFVLSVYYFPTGVVGRLRAGCGARKPCHDSWDPRSDRVHYDSETKPMQETMRFIWPRGPAVRRPRADRLRGGDGGELNANPATWAACGNRAMTA
jgi:hypothetical protein